MPGYNDLATTDPELVLEWDYEKNVDMQLFEVSRNTMRSVWWNGACGHTWKLQSAEGITEALKANDPIGWTRRMNNIAARAEEIVREELIYT